MIWSDLFCISFVHFCTRILTPRCRQGSTERSAEVGPCWCQIFGTDHGCKPLPKTLIMVRIRNSLLKPAFSKSLSHRLLVSSYQLVYSINLVGTIPWFYKLASIFHSEIRPESQQTQAGPAGKDGDFVWQLRWGFDANGRVMYQWIKGLKQQTCGFIDRSEAFTNKNRDFTIHVGLCFFSFAFHLAWHWIQPQRKPTSDLWDSDPNSTAGLRSFHVAW